jgi:hypothetical protein
MVKAAKVFVPGGQPTVTYVPRENEGLEQALWDHVDSPYRLLSVTGPTKSGKTVLVRAVLTERLVWIPAAALTSVPALWEQAAYKLGLYSSQKGIMTHEDASGSTFGGTASALVASGTVGQSDSQAVTRGREESREVPLHLVVPEKLREEDRVLVLDDFHYLPRDLQREIVRSIKPALFEGTPIILISVPHRTYDSVRAEPEMTGRVVHLEVPLWTDEELHGIAASGFKELNASVADSVLLDFVEQAAGSPHLMQEFCLRLCRQNGLTETVTTSQRLVLDDRKQFFGDCALEAASRVEFDRFLRGLQPRSKRKVRRLKGGTKADIYRAVVLAIVAAGPKSPLTLEEIRQALAGLLVAPDVPAKHEVTRVLRALDELAKTGSESDPVIEWDDEECELYILDPFFGFAVRWIGGNVA